MFGRLSEGTVVKWKGLRKYLHVGPSPESTVGFHVAGSRGTTAPPTMGCSAGCNRPSLQSRGQSSARYHAHHNIARAGKSSNAVDALTASRTSPRHDNQPSLGQKSRGWRRWAANNSQPSLPPSSFLWKICFRVLGELEHPPCGSRIIAFVFCIPCFLVQLLRSLSLDDFGGLSTL
jgi:hypothetical protein